MHNYNGYSFEYCKAGSGLETWVYQLELLLVALGGTWQGKN